MTDKVTVADVLFAAKTLTLEEQKELNSLLVDSIHEHQRVASQKAASAFRTNDHVMFIHSKTNTPIYGTIRKFNPTRVIVESLYDKHGFVGRPVEWTVPASFLTKIDALPPMPAARPISPSPREQLRGELKDIGTLVIGPDGKVEIK